MHPDLYTDIESTLEGLRKYLDENPMETKEDIYLYSRALEAAAHLESFLYAVTSRRDNNASQN